MIPGRNKGLLAVDLTAPVVVITSPANAAQITGITNLTATATDVGSGVKSVQWQVDGVNYGSLKTVSPFTQAFDPSAYSIGNHTITAIVTDNANRQSSSSITVNVQSPRLLDVGWPGRNSTQQFNDTLLNVPFNTLNTDQWGVGLGGGLRFTIPAGMGGTYTLWFQVYQPGYAWTGVFGQGWSGTADGGSRIKTSRYGDSPNQSWSSSDTSQPEITTSNLVGLALLAGDWIECWSWGHATGTGVQNWNARAQFTRTGP